MSTLYETLPPRAAHRPAAAGLRAGSRRLRILVIASLRYPIAQPYAGGLEASTAALVACLQERGHDVSLAAASGSDPTLNPIDYGTLPIGDPDERIDITKHPTVVAAENATFEAILNDVRTGRTGPFDVIHNNSPHPLPVAMASLMPAPVVTALHTPPGRWARTAMAQGQRLGGAFVAVSSATARAWAPLVNAEVIHNGVDMSVWRPGDGGGGIVWSGRIVAEKAPHLAIELAEAVGMPITLAGAVIDQDYFDEQIAPRLGDSVRFVGHLEQSELNTLVGSAALALATPVWDEPFGLVVTEALACGTPVVAFARGGIPELLDDSCGRLLTPPAGDRFTRADLAAAIPVIEAAVTLDREGVRRVAAARFSQDAMVDRYESLYRRLALWADAA